MTFRESGYLFEFPLSWVVLKFDEHRFYKYLSGDGFKGVDFLCLTPNGELHFLEIKNYLNLFTADGIDPSDALRSNPAIYADTYWKKYLDSKHLIELVHKFYLRKRWYRLAIKLGLHQWRINKKKDWVLWEKFYEILQESGSEKYFDLWLELEGDQTMSVSTMHSEILLSLKNKAVGTAVKINIYDSKNPGYLVALPFQS